MMLTSLLDLALYFFCCRMFIADAISPASSTPVAPPPAMTMLPFRLGSEMHFL